MSLPSIHAYNPHTYDSRCKVCLAGQQATGHTMYDQIMGVKSTMKQENGKLKNGSITDGLDLTKIKMCGYGCTLAIADERCPMHSRPQEFKQEAGKKFDLGKPRLDLLDREALVQIANVLAFGAQKYDAHNWRKGMSWSRLLAAAMRHIQAFNDGENRDPETGLSHLAHAGCCIMFLLNYEKTNQELDDRFYPYNEQGLPDDASYEGESVSPLARALKASVDSCVESMKKSMPTYEDLYEGESAEIINDHVETIQNSEYWDDNGVN